MTKVVEMKEEEFGEKEKRVMAFVKKNGDSPLIFGADLYIDARLRKEFAFPPSAKSLTSKIYVILNAAQKRGSVDSKGNYQCHAGARRSALDVWRLLMGYGVNVSIFQVMRCMCRLKMVGRSYCSTVQRRVFRPANPGNIWDSEKIDEFKLHIEDWRSIGIKK